MPFVCVYLIFIHGFSFAYPYAISDDEMADTALYTTFRACVNISHGFIFEADEMVHAHHSAVAEFHKYLSRDALSEIGKITGKP